MTVRFLSLAGLAAGAAVVVPLAVPAASAPASAADPEFHASLHASGSYPAARGHSEYERSSSHREVEVTVRALPQRLRGHWLTVYINRVRVGVMHVSSAGRAEREWSTEHGQRVPWAGSGTAVRVRTSGGALVASGAYHRETDS